MLLQLVEESAWAGVRASSEALGLGSVRINGVHLDGGELYPGPAVLARHVAIDEERRASFHGLAPGRWRFKTFPEDVRVEPERLKLHARSRSRCAGDAHKAHSGERLGGADRPPPDRPRPASNA